MRMVAAVVTILLAGAVTPAFAGEPHGLDALLHQKITWAACAEADLAEAGVECSSVQVPMDYRAPEGKLITVAISRRQARDRAQRRGVLMTNPGGPGGEGLGLATILAEQPAGAVYDVIGMDPRGVGASTRLLCGRTGFPDVTSRPTEAELPLWGQYAKEVEANCARVGGELRQHVTTMNTARDMDLIRSVLGERKISYLGYSYGTFLGAMYGQLFPEHLDRSVLDSALDPGKTWHEQDYDTVATLKDNLAAWEQWVAQRDKSLHLGSSSQAVQQVLDRFATVLAKRGLGALSDVTTFDAKVGERTRYRAMWAPFARNLAKLLPALDGGAVDTAAVQEIVGKESAQRGERNVDGVYPAVTCDWHWPSDVDSYYADMRRIARDFPYGLTANFMAPKNCAFTKGRDPMVAIGARQYPAGLVVQGEGDTQTAYPNGVAMAVRLREPLISVLDDGTHGHFASTGNACVDQAVNAYLVAGTLPARRTACAATDKAEDIPVDGSTAPMPSVQRSLSEVTAEINARPIR
ncbi:alpha/beta fold hydrolase [Kutzneria albida]|uniref:AB hydrolase-1 domain-containing protein n=1 Tax=Kutzneria albida DSM 43870 TaxID=1449976 RepID=W5W4A6_9PSEU|nr:alpha/beta fold hydrolase [Kutzneria albida]AHH95667.1 hypothetical protein KALB_2298 [Kutzneria albida DSM 43870]